MSIWTRVYRHANYAGTSAFANLQYLSPPNTYLRISKNYLDTVNLHDRISSLQIGASSWEHGGRVILFQHSNYRGRYAMFNADPGDTVAIPNLSAENFNDRTSSILIVRRHGVEMWPMQIGTMGGSNLRDHIDSMIGGIPRLSMRGEATITWDLWPSFDPSRKFVYLKIPVRVDVEHWFDYDAEVRLWVYFYINHQNKLRGYVAWYGAWVEGGILTGKILDRLMGDIPGRIGDINTMVADAASAVEAFDFTALYYLPGRAQSTGHVNDDVTIVLVKRF